MKYIAMIAIIALSGCNSYEKGDCIIISNGNELIEGELVSLDVGRRTIWYKTEDRLTAVLMDQAYLIGCDEVK